MKIIFTWEWTGHLPHTVPLFFPYSFLFIVGSEIKSKLVTQTWSMVGDTNMVHDTNVVGNTNMVGNMNMVGDMNTVGDINMIINTNMVGITVII